MCQYRPGWVRSGSLAALCSQLLILWINADCLGMTWNCGPHKESEGECRPAPFCRREKQTGVHREFLAGIIFLLLSISFRSPSSSTTHTHTLSPFVFHSQSSCSLFHFSFTLWKPFSCTHAFAFLRSRWNNISVTTALTCPAEYVRTRVCASTNTCECMFVVFCGRSKAQCGWTLREEYEEDNNSSKKHRHWLQLAELALRARVLFGVSH